MMAKDCGNELVTIDLSVSATTLSRALFELDINEHAASNQIFFRVNQCH